MSSSTAQTDPTLIDRYQNYRTRRFLKHERTYAHSLPALAHSASAVAPGGRLGRHVRVHGRGKPCCARSGFDGRRCSGCRRACVFFPLWIVLQIVSGRQGDAPQAALDEYEVQQRNTARSIGLTVTQNLMLIPIVYLIFGSVITGGTDTDMAYAGGLMALTVLLIGGCTPAMILGWIRPSPTPRRRTARPLGRARRGSAAPARRSRSPTARRGSRRR